MQVKCKREADLWVCYLNPHGDGWYCFGQGKTRRLAISDAFVQYEKYNRITDAN